MFYKTQRELANAINNLIDSYWNNEIAEGVLIEKIKILYANNPGKIIKNHKFTTILMQQTGKRRLVIVSKVLGIDLLEECNG
jgi:uncharacterized protein (TIGR04540 family)